MRWRAASVLVVALLCQQTIGVAGEGAAERNLGSFDYDWYGSVPDDGRYLAYVEWETGDLVVRDLQTGEIRNQTNKKGRWEYVSSAVPTLPGTHFLQIVN